MQQANAADPNLGDSQVSATTESSAASCRIRIDVPTAFSALGIGAIHHNLYRHPLVQLPRLPVLAEFLFPTEQCRFITPDSKQDSVFVHTSNSPVGRTMQVVFHRNEEPGSWIALYNIQTNPTYCDFLRQVTDRLQTLIAHEQPGAFWRRRTQICFRATVGDALPYSDQSEVVGRSDVLVYASDPLDYAPRIIGPLRENFSVSSTVPDTDIVCATGGVRPNGRSTNIQEGALRLRDRNGFSVPELMQPERSCGLVVDIRSTAYLIPRGDRLGLQLISSSFTRLKRNLNIVSNNLAETVILAAEAAIKYLQQGSSWLEIPVLAD